MWLPDKLGLAWFFDAGLGSSYLARIVGQKKAREIRLLCRQYDAQQALDMGLRNCVVPLEKLEEETLIGAEKCLLYLHWLFVFAKQP